MTVGYDRLWYYASLPLVHHGEKEADKMLKVHYLDRKNIIYMVLRDATPCNLLDFHSCLKKKKFSPSFVLKMEVTIFSKL